MLNEAKLLRPRPRAKLLDWGQNLKIEAKTTNARPRPIFRIKAETENKSVWLGLARA